MKCDYCKNEIEAGSSFCRVCGSKQDIVEREDAEDVKESKDIKAATVSVREDGENGNILLAPGVVKGTDDVYRWVYELNIWRNPVILITLLKILLFASLVPILLVSV